ncbi:hypothetical protein CMV_023827 [Castanea mollissima]|uniref:Apple domain-containing protein n=1 Tax=Castanea mollissima TaxID=60419 RepID=A0A8J4QFV5_9ROSI|nr:hypothetical protein CMV_023827 [Castanea mollissima]
MNPNGSPQIFLYKGSTLHWRTSPLPWPSTPTTEKYNFVNNQDEISFSYSVDDPSIMTRVVLDSTGLIQKLVWDDGVHQWKEQWSAPKYRCEKYGRCGSYSKCSPDNINRFECMCLPGYEPKSHRDWDLRDVSNGCVRKHWELSVYGNGEGFVKVERLKLPDSSFNVAWIGMGTGSSECEQACLMNCSCTAFTTTNIDGKGTSCLAWFGELMDILEYTSEGSDLNVRVDAIELGNLLSSHFHKLLHFFLLSVFSFSFSEVSKEIQRLS